MIEKSNALAEALRLQSVLEEELRALSTSNARTKQELTNAQIENEKLKKECDLLQNISNVLSVFDSDLLCKVPMRMLILNVG